MEERNTILVTKEDCRSLCSAIMQLPADVIAAFIALHENTKLLNILKDKINDKAKRNSDEFQRRLDKQTVEIVSLPREELTIRMFLNFNQSLELLPRHYVSIRDFEDNSEEIIKKVIGLTRNTYKDFEGSTLTDLSLYYVEKIIADAREKFSEMSEEQQEDAIEALRSYISTLPEEKQQQIKRQLGVGELKNEYLKKVIKSGAIWGALKVIATTAGFSFYTGLTSLLAGTVGLVGLTLPFGIYMSATSIVAVLANPIFMMGLFTGYGYYFISKNDKAIRQRLITIIIAQLVLQGLENNCPLDSSGQAELSIKVWKEAWGHVEEARKNYFAVCEKLAEVQARLNENKAKIEECKATMKQADKEREEISNYLHRQILEKPEDLEQGFWGGSFINYGREIIKLQERIERIKEEQANKSMLEKIASFGQLKERVCLTKGLDDKANGCVKDVKNSWNQRFGDFPEPIAAKLMEWDSLNSRYNLENKNLNELKQLEIALKTICETYQNDKTKAEDIKKQAEGKFWGFDKL